MTDLERWAQDMLPNTPQRIDLTQWAQEFRDVYAIAEALCKTPFVPREMMGRQADVAAAIMKGRELGLDPFDALGSIYIVHGRVGFYAEFMRRRIVQAGHQLNIIESTESRCIIEGTRKDTGQKHRAQFTADQARRAGIDLGKYPADKLIARATSRLCTQAFPDVLSGTLIAEDLIDGLIPTDNDDVTDHITAEGPHGPPVQRKRPTKAAKAARTQPRAAATPTEPDTDIAELLGDTPQTVGSLQPDEPPQAQSGHALKTATRAERRPSDPTPQPTGPEPEQQLPVQPDPVANEQLDEQPPPDEPATVPQNRKMHALFRELGLDDRNDRLTITSHILGYNLTTSSGLTRNEARQIIDTIEIWQIHDNDNPVADRVNDILNQAAINQAEAEESEP